KPTKNVVISERDYKNLVTAARDNDRLKQHVRNLMSTDMAREYKKLSKEHGQVKEKYSGLVERFNENVNDYNELLEEKDRKSTRLNPSHVSISYAVFCLKKKKRAQERGDISGSGAARWRDRASWRRDSPHRPGWNRRHRCRTSAPRTPAGGRRAPAGCAS